MATTPVLNYNPYRPAYAAPAPQAGFVQDVLPRSPGTQTPAANDFFSRAQYPTPGTAASIFQSLNAQAGVGDGPVNNTGYAQSQNTRQAQYQPASAPTLKEPGWANISHESQLATPARTSNSSIPLYSQPQTVSPSLEALLSDSAAQQSVPSSSPQPISNSTVSTSTQAPSLEQPKEQYNPYRAQKAAPASSATHAEAPGASSESVASLGEVEQPRKTAKEELLGLASQFLDDHPQVIEKLTAQDIQEMREAALNPLRRSEIAQSLLKRHQGDILTQFAKTTAGNSISEYFSKPGWIFKTIRNGVERAVLFVTPGPVRPLVESFFGFFKSKSETPDA